MPATPLALRLAIGDPARRGANMLKSQISVYGRVESTFQIRP
jgi:hypothetical protein